MNSLPDDIVKTDSLSIFRKVKAKAKKFGLKAKAKAKD